MIGIVIVDQPGQPIVLTFYSGAEIIARVELDPLRALRLGLRLIGAAERRFVGQ